MNRIISINNKKIENWANSSCLRIPNTKIINNLLESRTFSFLEQCFENVFVQTSKN